MSKDRPLSFCRPSVLLGRYRAGTSRRLDVFGTSFRCKSEEELEHEREVASETVETTLGCLSSLPLLPRLRTRHGGDGQGPQGGEAEAEAAGAKPQEPSLVRWIEGILFDGDDDEDDDADVVRNDVQRPHGLDEGGAAAASVEGNEKEEAAAEDEWKAGLTLLRELLDLPPLSPPLLHSPPQGAATIRSDLGAVDRKRSRRTDPRVVLPSCALFQSVVEASIFVNGLASATSGGGATDFNGERHRIASAALVTILAFSAVRSESISALRGDRMDSKSLPSTFTSSSSSSSSTLYTKWRRLRSMAFESIALYQRLFLRSFAMRGWMWTKSDLVDNVEALTEILYRHVMPSCDLASRAMQTRAAASCGVNLRPDLLEAGAIASALGCCELIATYYQEGQGGKGWDLMELAVESILRVDGGSWIDKVLLHPVRRYYYRTNIGRMPRDDIGFWICSDGGQDGKGDDTNRLPRSGGNDDREILCGMGTDWDVLGPSHVALHLFSDLEGPNQALSFPYVYSPSYLFVLVFPHIVSSLERNLEASRSDDDFDHDEKEREEGCIHGRNLASRISVRWSIDALRRLLLKVSSVDENLAVLQNNSETYLAKVMHDADGPVSPVGCIQLLLNVIVSESERRNDFEPCHVLLKFDQNNDSIIMHPVEILHMVRNLLKRFSPLFSIQCIQILLDRNPYPSLEPLLLDLLRPEILAPAKGTTDSLLVSAIMKILEPYTERMQGHCQVVELAVDGPLSSNNKHVGCHSRLTDLEGLYDSVEVYTCAVSLIRLVCMRLRRHSNETREEKIRTLHDVKVRSSILEAVGIVRDLLSCLEAELCMLPGAKDVKANGRLVASVPDANHAKEHYKLFLLEDALGEMLRTFRDVTF